MKKLAIIALIAATTGAASAAEVGVRVGHHDDLNADFSGITLNQTIKGVKTEFALDRHVKDGYGVNRVSAMGVMDLTKVGNLSISAKGGLAHLSPSRGDSGMAALVGLGLTYPVDKTTSLVVDVTHMRGQTRVQHLDGPAVTAGIKFAF